MKIKMNNSINRTHIKQHTVSQGYLSHFSRKKRHKPKICVCRKENKDNIIYVESIENVCYMKNIYDVTTRNNPKYWEQYFGKYIEPAYISSLDNVISKTFLVRRGFSVLNSIDKQIIGKLILFQIMRNPTFMKYRIDEGLKYGRIFWNSLHVQFGNAITESQYKAITEYLCQEGGIKDLYFENVIRDGLSLFNKLIENMTWLVLCNNTEMPFITSDNPALIYYDYSNQSDNIYYKIVTWNVDIYYPISPHVMLLITPKNKIELKGGLDERFIVNNAELQMICEINKKQYYESRKEVYCHPLYENEFRSFIAEIV